MGIYMSTDEIKQYDYNSNTMGINKKIIYLAGIVCSSMETHKWFIENSRIHAEIIMNDVKDKI